MARALSTARKWRRTLFVGALPLGGARQSAGAGAADANAVLLPFIHRSFESL